MRRFLLVLLACSISCAFAATEDMLIPIKTVDRIHDELTEALAKLGWINGSVEALQLLKRSTDPNQTLLEIAKNDHFELAIRVEAVKLIHRDNQVTKRHGEIFERLVEFLFTPFLPAQISNPLIKGMASFALVPNNVKIYNDEGVFGTVRLIGVPQMRESEFFGGYIRELIPIIPRETVAPSVEEILKNKSMSVRLAAAEGLSQRPPDRFIVSRVFEWIKVESDWQVRKALVKAVGSQAKDNPSEAVGRLSVLSVRDPSADVRKAAIDAEMGLRGWSEESQFTVDALLAAGRSAVARMIVKCSVHLESMVEGRSSH